MVIIIIIIMIIIVIIIFIRSHIGSSRGKTEARNDCVLASSTFSANVPNFLRTTEANNVLWDF